MGLLEYFGERIKWFFRPLKCPHTANFHKLINLTVQNQFTRYIIISIKKAFWLTQKAFEKNLPRRRFELMTYRLEEAESHILRVFQLFYDLSESVSIDCATWILSRFYSHNLSLFFRLYQKICNPNATSSFISVHSTPLLRGGEGTKT